MFNQSLLISILSTNYSNRFGFLEWQMHIYDYANQAGVGRLHPHINALIHFVHSFQGTIRVIKQWSIIIKVTPRSDPDPNMIQKWWHHDDVIWWFIKDFLIYKFSHWLCTQISRLLLASEQYSIFVKPIPKKDSALKITSMYWWHDDVIWWVVTWH